MVDILSYYDSSYRETKEEMVNYIKHLRYLAKNEQLEGLNTFKEVIFTETREGFLDNQYVKRLVVFLRGTGCYLARETGGCTFCGFYNATNFGVKISDKDYILQIKDVIENEKVKFNQYPIICMYNDGSLLREEEISFETLIKIINILNEKDNLKKIVIEARMEDITEEKIFRMKEATNKEIEIAVGFESANPVIRDLCINKNFHNEIFESKVEIANKYNISIIPLLMLKPPFLSEYEAIEDYIESLVYLEQFRFKRIDMELPTVEKYTLVHELWKKDMYKPAKLWSVIKILRHKKRLGLKTPLYISPTNYSVPSESKASNCPKCDSLIYKLFEEYNKHGDIELFDSLNCTCKEDWIHLIENKKLNNDLSKRVNAIMKILTKGQEVYNEVAVTK